MKNPKQIKNKIAFRVSNIVISILGIIPLAKEGLITPHVLTAFLCGLADFAFVGIAAFNMFELGLEIGGLKNG